MAKAKTVRCADCAHYPWAPGADPELLPPHPCHPALPWQRWTAAARDMKRLCPYFQPARAAAARAEQDPEPERQPAAQAAKGGGSEGGEVTAHDADAGASGEAAPAD